MLTVPGMSHWWILRCTLLGIRAKKDDLHGTKELQEDVCVHTCVMFFQLKPRLTFKPRFTYTSIEGEKRYF